MRFYRVGIRAGVGARLYFYFRARARVRVRARYILITLLILDSFAFQDTLTVIKRQCTYDHRASPTSDMLP